MSSSYNFSVITASGEILIENAPLDKKIVDEIICNKLFYSKNPRVRMLSTEAYVYPIFANDGSLNGYIIIELPKNYELGVLISYLLDKLFEAKLNQLINSKKYNKSEYEKYNLTNKEQKVIELISEGKTDDEIALLCYCTKSTIRKNISSIFLKIGLRRRVDLVRFYYENIYFYSDRFVQ